MIKREKGTNEAVSTDAQKKKPEHDATFSAVGATSFPNVVACQWRT